MNFKQLVINGVWQAMPSSPANVAEVGDSMWLLVNGEPSSQKHG